MTGNKSASRKGTMRRAFTTQNIPSTSMGNISAFFDSYDRVRKEQSKNILLTVYYKGEMKIPAMGEKPLMRYVPSRHIM